MKFYDDIGVFCESEAAERDMLCISDFEKPRLSDHILHIYLQLFKIILCE